jgi:hypothetical protein
MLLELRNSDKTSKFVTLGIGVIAINKIAGCALFYWTRTGFEGVFI